MAKAAYIDIENLKAEKTPNIADFPDRDAAFEYLLGRLDELNERIAELQTSTRGPSNYILKEPLTIQKEVRIFRTLEKQDKRIKVLEAEATK